MVTNSNSETRFICNDTFNTARKRIQLSEPNFANVVINRG